MQRFLWVTLLVGLSATWLSGQTTNQDDEDIHGREIALIDMAEVFKQYDKFNALRDEIKDEITQADAEARKMAAKAAVLKSDLAKLTEGTPEANEKQLQLNALQLEFNTFKQKLEKSFKAQEARVYQQVYLEVGDVVKEIASERNFSIVFRYNRKPLAGVTDPKEILQAMNKQVVYAEQGRDITEATLKRLNDNYEAASK